MSLMAMNRGVKKYGWLVGAIMAAMMLVGVISGLGNNLSGPRAAAVATADAEEKPVVTVGSQKITRRDLDVMANQAVEMMAQQNPMMGMQRPTADQMDQYRLAAVNMAKERQAIMMVAETAHLTVTDAELAAEREKQWKETLRPVLAAKLGLSADASDDKIANALSKVSNEPLDHLKSSNLPDDKLRFNLLIQRLQTQYKSQIGADEASVRRSLSDMTVRHILVKFGASGLPEAQARSKAEKLLAAVKADPSKMGALATANTDDGGSKKTAGIYEWTPSGRQSIMRDIVAALDTLKPGETYPELVRVEDPSYSGFHIVRLEAVKEGKEFPKDFAANKDKYLADYVQARVTQRMKKAIDATVPSVPVKIDDPALQAEQYLEDVPKLNGKERDDKLKQALAELEKVRKQDDPLWTALVRKGMVYAALKQPTEAIAAYQEALADHKTPETRIALAMQYVALKQFDKARGVLEEIEAGLIPNSQMENAISDLYLKIGDKAKAAAAKKRGSEMQQRELQAMIQRMQEQQGPPTAAPSLPPTGPATAPSKKSSAFSTDPASAPAK